MTMSRYIWSLLLVAGVLFGIWELSAQVVKFGCLPPHGEKPAAGWLQSCASARVGELDEATILFGTENSVTRAIQSADVLIFGDSRMEFAISRGEGSEWFASHGLRFYLLAFGGGAESGEAQQLLHKFHLHPSALIFNVDPYFTGGLSRHAQAVAADPSGELRAIEDSNRYIDRYSSYCRYLGWLCGRTSAGYRALDDGHLFNDQPERFWFGKAISGRFPLRKPPKWDTANFAVYLQNAREVIAAAGTDPNCIIFTVVPNNEQDDALAAFLAEQTGGAVIAPRFSGLATSDNSHLTVESSKIWTPAFLEQSAALLKRCVHH